MFDRYATAFIKPALDAIAKPLALRGVRANHISLAGFAIGLGAAILIAVHAYLAGLVAIFISRLCDALDGAVARQNQASDAGAFLDIALDMLFYASIPLAFALANPKANALAASVLLAGFVGTASSFLAFAVLAAKRGLASSAYPHKSFYFTGGLTEAGETLAVFAAMCLWPQYFAHLAWGFAALCLLTTAARVYGGYKALG